MDDEEEARKERASEKERRNNWIGNVLLQQVTESSPFISNLYFFYIYEKYSNDSFACHIRYPLSSRKKLTQKLKLKVKAKKKFHVNKKFLNSWKEREGN